MNFIAKEKQTHRSQNQTYGYQRGNVGGSNKLELGLIHTHYYVF